VDELISTVEGARNRLVDLQNLSDDELQDLQDQFQRVQQRASESPTEALKAVKGEPG